MEGGEKPSCRPGMDGACAIMSVGVWMSVGVCSTLENIKKYLSSLCAFCVCVTVCMCMFMCVCMYVHAFCACVHAYERVRVCVHMC